jgi:pimeloyl-ACP methyl ester carboxylesterase
MAQDTIAFIDSVIGAPVCLLGMSDGATLALDVTRHRPDLVRKLVFVAGVFHRDGWEAGVLDGEPPDFFKSSYAELSPDGIDHYEVVLQKLKTMHAEGPTLTVGDLAKINCRSLIMVGDDDEVRLEHAVAMYRSIPYAELAVVPGTSHGLLHEKPELCNRLIMEFVTSTHVQTLAPIRRAS